MRYIILALLLTAVPASAMNRWLALAQYESGNNDFAVGKAKEVSRYQIKPREWRSMTSWPLAYATNPACSLAVARKLLDGRVAHFEKRYGRSPSDKEFYALWNCPARPIRRSQVVEARCSRFAKLCAQ